MILSPGPIDVSRVLSALRMFAELGYLQVPPTESVFESDHSRELLTEGAAVFVAYVEDDAEHENDIRRGLCWLLNQPDEVLEPVLVAARMPFPVRDIAARRCYLETLWDAAFASWQVLDDTLADHPVNGLPDRH